MDDSGPLADVRAELAAHEISVPPDIPCEARVGH